MRTLILSFFFAFAHAQTYLDPSGPIFSGTFASARLDQPTSIKVVTYNVGFSEQKEAILRTLTTHPDLKNTDILLLQEIVGEPGSSSNTAAEFAARLNMNYVFIPSQIHPKLKMDYGSAILSRWPMSDFQKIILPGKHLRWRTQRAVVGARVMIGDRAVRAYSAHLENMFWDTFTNAEQSRAHQVLALLNKTPKSGPVIIGGDFNALNPSGITYLLGFFWWANYTRVSSMLPTENKIPIGIDHIFVRNLNAEDYGTVYDFSGSDHAPVWAQIRL